LGRKDHAVAGNPGRLDVVESGGVWPVGGLRGGVDVVDVQSVDADRARQTAVFGDGREVVADMAAFKENGQASIAVFDRAVGVVPLVDPANGKGRTGVKRPGRFARFRGAEPIEYTLENPRLICAGNECSMPG
jgi:hypothetical protein